MSEEKIQRPLLASYGGRRMTNAGNAASTLAAPRDGDGAVKFYEAAITADRAVTLTTASAQPGMRWRIVRQAAATGAFDVNVGTGPLKALAAAGDWCEVMYDGTAWVLTAAGAL